MGIGKKPFLFIEDDQKTRQRSATQTNNHLHTYAPTKVKNAKVCPKPFPIRDIFDKGRLGILHGRTEPRSLHTISICKLL